VQTAAREQIDATLLADVGEHDVAAMRRALVALILMSRQWLDRDDD
jgi:hypothetical protein